MNFASFGFALAFLPLAVWSYRLAGSRREARLVAALVLSLAFYLLNDPASLPILAASIAGNWYLARSMAGRPERKRLLLTLGILANLGLLGFYKYAGLLTGAVPPRPLPLGISYFTFTQIAFLVDTARGQAAAAEALDYAVFVGWFPHLAAGPLLSPREMLPQLARKTAPLPSARDFAVGLTLFTTGLFKKTCLSPLFVWVGSDVFHQAGLGQPIGFQEAWIACLASLFETYFDFCGYSEMAVGVSRLFGLHLPINFHAPFRASSPVEFWTRWHITLGRFLREYLYRPLTRKRQIWRHYAALFVVMFAVAVWHGATLPLLAFGAYQGILVAGNHLCRRWGVIRRDGGALQHWAGRVFTLAAIAFSVSLWRIADWDTSMRMVRSLAGFGDGHPWQHGLWPVMTLAAAVAAGWTLPTTIDLIADELPAWSLRTRTFSSPKFRWRENWAWAATVGLILALALGNIPDVRSFQYFEF